MSNHRPLVTDGLISFIPRTGINIILRDDGRRLAETRGDRA